MFCKIIIQPSSQLSIQGYGQEVLLAILENNDFSYAAVNGCFQS